MGCGASHLSEITPAKVASSRSSQAAAQAPATTVAAISAAETSGSFQAAAQATREEAVTTPAQAPAKAVAATSAAETSGSFLAAAQAPTEEAVTTSARAPAKAVAATSAAETVTPAVATAKAADSSPLSSSKWVMLMDWTGWKEKDMFGWDQPPVSEVVGSNGRLRLSNMDRMHDYQVSISFPGADFDKGCEGHRSDLLDHTGKVLASSGTEFAEKLQEWLCEGWLDGNQFQALDHIFVCSKNLKYCPGSVKALNFRHYSAATPSTDDNEEGVGSVTSTAILNENWAMYLRESFLEARVVVFVINEDWLDSVPCNQEFEALITRKMMYSRPSADGGEGIPEAIIFIDITDNKFNERWGAKLPQLKEGMAFEASKSFEVFQITYNAQSTAEEKLDAQRRFVEVVSKYATKFPPEESHAYVDLTTNAPEVYWPNWLYFKSLDGTNGWNSIQEIYDMDQKGMGFDYGEQLNLPVSHEIPSRRFRVRVMGITGDTFQEGYKYMCQPLKLIDKDTGENIVAPGKGYWKAAGERMGCLGFSHWCGPKQYSWIEWLVPDDQPPVVISHAGVHVNARHCIVEVLPVSEWPNHGEALKEYQVLGFDGISSINVSMAQKEPKWVTLHECKALDPTTAAYPEGCHLPDSSPACSMFRVRFLGTQDKTAKVVAAKIHLNGFFSEGLYPIGGGQISGSGGDTEAEDTAPALAFDGDDQTRWVDVHGGGIGNTSRLVYEHPEEVCVEEYSITTQMYALSSYHSHLNGAPRDWTLQAKAADTDEWVVVDQQTYVYFTNHQEKKTFIVKNPCKASAYMLEFTAVSAGCASRSIQVGMVELYARQSEGARDLLSHQLVLLSSAYNSKVSDVDAFKSTTQLAPAWGLEWASPSQLQVQIPGHPDFEQAGSEVAGGGEKLCMVKGGKLGWVIGEGRVSNWYDHPVEIDMLPKVTPEQPDCVAETRAMLVVRPRKEAMLVDEVHHVSFRSAYPDGEAELVYHHPRAFVMKAYCFRSSGNYVRGDPRSWVLHGGEDDASGGDSRWCPLHEVKNFLFPDRLAQAHFYLLDNTRAFSRYRLVITEMNAMVGLLHLSDFVLYKYASEDDNGEVDDEAIVEHRELAHVTMKMKPREEKGRQVRLGHYRVEPLDRDGPMDAAPVQWTLEGFTSEYQ